MENKVLNLVEPLAQRGYFEVHVLVLNWTSGLGVTKLADLSLQTTSCKEDEIKNSNWNSIFFFQNYFPDILNEIELGLINQAEAQFREEQKGLLMQERNNSKFIHFFTSKSSLIFFSTVSIMFLFTVFIPIMIKSGYNFLTQLY